MTDGLAESPQTGSNAVMQERLGLLAKLDRRLAWVVTCGPPIGFVVAIGLILAGYPIRAYQLWIWLVMHTLILIGVEVGFHRHFPHRSFKLARGLRTEEPTSEV